MSETRPRSGLCLAGLNKPTNKSAECALVWITLNIKQIHTVDGSYVYGPKCKITTLQERLPKFKLAITSD